MVILTLHSFFFRNDVTSSLNSISSVRLNRLTLQYGTINSSGVNALAHLLKFSQLHSLELDTCRIRSSSVYCEMFESISKSSLKFFRFKGDFCFVKEDAKALAKLLTESGTLEKVEVSNEKTMSIEIIRPLLQSMFNSGVKKLILDNTCCTPTCTIEYERFFGLSFPRDKVDFL